MSVYMSLRVKADADKMERFAQEHEDLMRKITDEAKSLGCIHHTFAAEDGDVIVMDEWESREAFEKFFNDNSDVQMVMSEVGAQSEPEIHFYRPLDTRDQF